MLTVRDDSLATEVKQKLVELQQSNRRELDEQLHVSELLYPRKAYWVRTVGERTTDESIGFFITGAAFHHVIQEALGAESSEVSLHMPGIVGTADVCGVQLVEIKTSRKWTVPQDPDPTYVEQLEAYMAMSGRQTAFILVVYFTSGRTWDASTPSTLELVSWRLERTSAELGAIRARMEGRRDDLNQALALTDPTLVPTCPEWMCGKQYKDKQTLCPYYMDCKPEGRYPLEALFPPKMKRNKRTTKVTKNESASTGLFKKGPGHSQGRGTGLFKKPR